MSKEPTEAKKALKEPGDGLRLFLLALAPVALAAVAAVGIYAVMLAAVVFCAVGAALWGIGRAVRGLFCKGGAA